MNRRAFPASRTFGHSTRSSPVAALALAFALGACASERSTSARVADGAKNTLSPARTALDRGDLDGALVEADAVLRAVPDDADALAVSGLALLLTAEKQIDTLTSDGFTAVLLEDALERLTRAPIQRETSYAAARAAWLLSRGERALELAHAAARTDGSEIGAWHLHTAARRIEYDAAWLTLRQRRAANVPESELVTLVAECLAHLDALALLNPDDPWTTQARAIVLASAGRGAESR